MHQTQRTQTRDLLRERGIDFALFGKPHTVTWLTGFTPPVLTGINPFAGGSPLIWYADGHFTLITVDAYESLAAPLENEPDMSLITYQGYTIEEPINPTLQLKPILGQLIRSTTEDARVGIEQQYVSDFVARHFWPFEGEAIDGWLEPLRMIKTEEEIAKLRRSFALTNIGHAAARAATVEGAREIDVWNALHDAIQSAAGQRVPVGNDCVVNTREMNIGGWPDERMINAGDSLIVDISVILDGYWSDSCATYYPDQRTPQQEAMHRVAADALAYATSLIRPGAVAREIDQQVRQFISEAGYTPYPHHTGHGVGASGHEAPRLVPYSDEVIEEGMVIALEPGIYLPGEAAVRLEDVMLVRADGVEVLTHHDKS